MIKSKTFGLVSAASLVAVLLSGGRASAETPASPAAAPGAPAESQDENEAARRHFLEGEAAFNANKPEEARALFLKAWGIRRTYDVASGLGQTELALGLVRDAAEHLDFAIRNYPPQLSRDGLRHIQEGFARAQRQVATLHMKVNRVGAEVLVDRELVGRTPLTAPLFLNPGPHTIEVSDEQDRVVRNVVTTVGTEQVLTIDLGGLRPAPADSSRHPRKMNLLPLFIGGGLTIVGASIGAGFARAADKKYDRVFSLRAALAPGACAEGAPPDSRCAELKAAADDHRRDRTISTTAFVFAGAALVATASYWFLARPKGVQLSGSVAKDSAALSLSGAW